jgi:hypothetical protein
LEAFRLDAVQETFPATTWGVDERDSAVEMR